MSILSLEDLEVTARIQLYPLIILTIAKLNPVLPEVVSMIVSPGERIPFFSACSMIYNAILSLDEGPGLKASTLA